VTAQQPCLDGLAAERRRRCGQVEGLARDPHRQQGSKGHAIAEEGVAPAERVERRDQDEGKDGDHGEAPGQARDRREDRRRVVRGDEDAQEHDAEHEEQHPKQLHAAAGTAQLSR